MENLIKPIFDDALLIRVMMMWILLFIIYLLIKGHKSVHMERYCFLNNPLLQPLATLSVDES